MLLLKIPKIRMLLQNLFKPNSTMGEYIPIFGKNEEQFSDPFKRSKLLITSINQYDDNCVEQLFFVRRIKM